MPDDKLRPRVLIVDDHLSMAETIADGLAETGYDTVALSSSREASERLQKEPFDALVTDLRMPDIDGLELLKISRHSKPSRPVIVMTAFSAVESAIESIRQGAFHYLTKPFKLDELDLFLHRALEDSKLRLEAETLRNTLMVLLGRRAELHLEEIAQARSATSEGSITPEENILTIRALQSRYATWVFETLGGRRTLTAEKLAVDMKTLARLLDTESERV